MFGGTFSLVFLGALFGMALYCAVMAHVIWRNPDNWHLEEETGELAFHGWVELAIFAVICAICLLFGLIVAVL